MIEGTIEGKERCSTTGREYGYVGHFLGEDSIEYLAWIVDEQRHVVGRVQGQLDPSPGGSDRTEVRAAFENLVRQSIRAGEFQSASPTHGRSGS